MSLKISPNNADRGAVKQLCDADTGAILVPRLEIAATAWQRTVGLIGRATLAVDSGLWLHPCNGIHTFGVRFPIDVVFLDAQGVVVHAVQNLRPCRVCGPVWKAKAVVELPAGSLGCMQIVRGARLEIRQSKQS